MDVQTLRNYVREQLDVDTEELPDSLLNIYLQDAFERTMAFDNRWPRYENTWSLIKDVGVDTIPVPADLNLPSITSIVSGTTPDVVLELISQTNAEQWFITNSVVATGTPAFISVWAGNFSLWPRYDTDSEYALTIRGHRQPVWNSGASAIPDLDERLHVALAYYAISLAYAQQEDEVLEGIYLARWNRDLTSQMRTLLEPVSNTPLRLGGGGTPYGVSGYVISPPVGP